MSILRYFSLVLVAVWVAWLPCVHAADIPFTASWKRVTKRVDGKTITVPEYVVYACDKPVSKAGLSSPATCSGVLRTYSTSELWVSGTYPTTASHGYVFMHVAARDAGGLESPLSKLQVLMYNTMNLPNIPEDFTLANSCVIIVNEVP